MGYYVRKVGRAPESTVQNWKLQFISYKKADTHKSNAKKPRKEWDVPKKRWPYLGFNTSMTLDQARARADQINQKLEAVRQEERRKKIEDEQKKLSQKFTAALPEVFKTEFEEKYLLGRYAEERRRKRFLTTWRAVQRMLIEIQVDPIDWYDDCYKFYDYFCKKRYSYSYAKKTLLVANLWGHFLSRRLGQPFLSIPNPRGIDKARILDAYFEKRGDQAHESDPITATRLEHAKPKLKREHYNWLYLSVWLGLRPQEIDQLKDRQLFRIEETKEQPTVIWIYQTKLKSVPPRYRWKLIPLVTEQQRRIPQIIRRKNFKRPRTQVIKKYFGSNTTLYGGRKGFTDLMIAEGQDFVHISQWMGHSSIDRTWRNYKSRRIVHFSELSDEAA